MNRLGPIHMYIRRIHRLLFSPFLTAALAVWSTGKLSAATITLPPSKDNTLYQSATGALGNGAGEFFFAGRTGSSGGNSIRRGLLAFDIAAVIPADSLITGVTLTLHVSNLAFNGTNSVVNLFRVSADWAEGTTDANFPEGPGAPAQPGDATWLHRLSPNSLWTTPGGDFASTSSGTATITGENRSFTWSGSGMVNDVQSWLTNPAMNFGWMVRGNETGTMTAMRFESRTSAAVANRPQLTVQYEPIPEASDTGLIAIAVLFLFACPARIRRDPPTATR